MVKVGDTIGRGVRSLGNQDDPDSLLALLPRDDRTAQTMAAFALVQDLTAGLRDQRKAAGLSQKQLADRLGVSQGRISQIESGLMDHAPSLEMVGRFAAACRRTVRVAFEAADAEPNPDDLSSLTVLEAAELSKLLEEKWGVSAAAPVAMAAAAAALAEAAEEQTEFTVVLTAGGDKTINVIKEVRSLRPDLGLKQAKDLVEGAPQNVVENVSRQAAEEIRQKLEDVGATIEVRGEE